MNTFRFFWNTHKWVGICASAFVLLVAITGFLLLIKKEVAWIQPPTLRGTAGPLEDCLGMDRLWDVVSAAGHPDFQRVEDIDRIDVRLAKRVYKVRSKHNHSELQVDATTGEILGQATRRSDFIESLHDGSWIGKPVHDYVMPIFAIALVFLVFSGIWLWLEPIVKRRRRKRRDARPRT